MPTLDDLVAGSQEACDKTDDPSVSVVRWRRLVNQAIKALFRKFAAQFADTWISTIDFTLAGSSNVYTMPADFAALRLLTLNPTTSQRRRVDPINLQSIDAVSGGPFRRVMGRKVYVEPPEQAPGNYRAWYTPRVQQLKGTIQVRVATDAALAPGPWIRDDAVTIEANIAGALVITGVTMRVGDIALVKDEANPLIDGLFTVTRAGAAAQIAKMDRITGYHEGDTTTVGVTIEVAEGTNAGVIYAITNAALIGSAAITFAPAASSLLTLDPALDQYDEWIEQYAAALALEKEGTDSSQQRERLKEIEADLEIDASSQEAGGQIAIADVDEFGSYTSRGWKGFP